MTQMNARLEIASRLMAGMRRGVYPLKELTELALREADALIAEEARTRRGMTDDEINEAMAKDPAAYRCPCSFQHPPHDNCDGNPGAVFGVAKVTAPAPDSLRAVAEELARAVEVAQARLDPGLVGDAYRAEMRRLGCDDRSRPDEFTNRVLHTALSRARALGLGGTGGGE